MTAGPGQQQLATPGLSPGPVGQMCAGVMGGSMGGTSLRKPQVNKPSCKRQSRQNEVLSYLVIVGTVA
eukprot:2551142-Amphidinium_carterae.1